MTLRYFRYVPKRKLRFRPISVVSGPKRRPASAFLYAQVTEDADEAQFPSDKRTISDKGEPSGMRITGRGPHPVNAGIDS